MAAVLLPVLDGLFKFLATGALCAVALLIITIYRTR